jgi:hypothetical protein
MAEGWLLRLATSTIYFHKSSLSMLKKERNRILAMPMKTKAAQAQRRYQTPG